MIDVFMNTINLTLKDYRHRFMIVFFTCISEYRSYLNFSNKVGRMTENHPFCRLLEKGVVEVTT